jgi:DNA topoisomerase-1
LVVEREREIDAFVPVEYWSIHALFNPHGSDKQYRAKLVKVNDKNLDMSLENEVQAMETVDLLQKASYKIGISMFQPDWSVMEHPSSLHFTAGSLTQTWFLTKRTMSIAQQLYEGLDLGNGEESGLITYMRTDSVHVSGESVKEARVYVRERYGESYLPERQPQYRTRAASAQEAHEAIRPTSVNRHTESLMKYLTRDQYAIYRLIGSALLQAN